MPQVYRKRPTDVIYPQFDLREWVAARVAEGSVAADMTFVLRATAGFTVTTTMNTVGLCDLVVSGGAVGRVFDFGIEGKTSDGDSIVDMRKLRIVDPSVFGDLPSNTEIILGNAIVTEGNEALVTETGETIVWL